MGQYQPSCIGGNQEAAYKEVKISNNHVSSDHRRVADVKMHAPAVSTGQGTKGSLGHIQNITEIKPADIITWVSTGKQKKQGIGINQQLHEEVDSCMTCTL